MLGFPSVLTPISKGRHLQILGEHERRREIGAILLRRPQPYQGPMGVMVGHWCVVRRDGRAHCFLRRMSSYGAAK